MLYHVSPYKLYKESMICVLNDCNDGENFLTHGEWLHIIKKNYVRHGYVPVLCQDLPHVRPARMATKSSPQN